MIASPSGLRGTVLVLTADRLVLGRGLGCDLRLDESHVSIAHAMLSRSGAQTTVRDLGSTNGTLVNGVRIASARVLQHGDVLRFGTVEARYEEPSVSAAPTAGVPAVWSPSAQSRGAAAPRVARPLATPPLVAAPSRAASPRVAAPLAAGPLAAGQRAAAPHDAPLGAAAPHTATSLAVLGGSYARFDITRQPAAPGRDAAGSRYDEDAEQIIEQQASRLRWVAATGSRARRLAAIGFVVFALGAGMIAGLALHFAAQVNTTVAAAAANPGAEPKAPSMFGPAIGGVPVGALGIAVALIGVVVMIVGIVPHLTATSADRPPARRPAPGRGPQAARR
ncbi:MAG TPA: FHA domain-containing protein [Streptosporangiaceae bacterium]|nr:FHA domain-containing protein [Streptosporangiaceae bacterium]